MPSIVKTIKDQIRATLDGLVADGVLAEVQEDDFKVNPLYDREFSAYPAAILTSPSVQAVADTNRQNLRTYTFDVVIIQKGENVASVTDIEELNEKIMDKFDNNFTLSGAAPGGLEPSATSPSPVTARGGRSYVIFGISLKAKALIDLTF